MNDSYNANADSMLAALKTLVGFPCRGRRIAVLGAMAELGRRSRAEHESVGRQAGVVGLDCLVVVGTEARPIAAAAREEGFGEVIEYSDVEQASIELPGLIGPDDLVLVKASRSERFERLVARLHDPSASKSDPVTAGAESSGVRSKCCCI